MKEALQKFILHWKQQQYVRGILLSGSYAVGIQNDHSDIDIRLILDDNTTTSFKGLETIDGFCFSYIGRSKAVTLKKFNRQFFSKVKMEARIYNIGEILYDPFNDVAEIIEVAKTYVETPLVKKEVSENDVQLYMYSLHKKYEYLINTSADDPFYDYNYIMYLKNALNYYADVLNIEMIFDNDSKLNRFLADEKYLSAYGHSKFPDQNFITIWTRALKEKNILNLKEINYYLRKNLHNFNNEKAVIYWKN